MAIITTIPQFCFSTELPEIINVTTSDADASVTVNLYVDSELEWSTELFASNSQVNLYDVRGIIEMMIRLNNEIHGVCSITFTEDENVMSTGNFTVVLSDRRMPPAVNWLSSHFLNTRTIQTINRTGKQYLNWAVYPAETMAYKIIATVETSSGQMQDIEWIRKSNSSVAQGFYSTLITVQEVEEHFANSGILRAFTVLHGSRSMKFFVVDEEPQLLLLIYNNFNADEYVPLYGVTIEKNKLEAAEAQYLRNKVKYDFYISQEFEFETALVTKEEGDFLAEVFTAQKVYLIDGTTMREILIDGECEISDSIAAENRIKFTYKFANT